MSKLMRNGVELGGVTENADEVAFANGGTTIKASNVQDALTELNEDLDNKLDNSTDVANAGKAVVVGEDGKLGFGDVASTVSNPNLIDNAWFNVNSRGQSEYFGQSYALDRWKFLNGNRNISYLTVNNDGSVTFKNTSDGAIYIAQKILANTSLRYSNCRLSILDINDNIYVSTNDSGANIDNMLIFYIENNNAVFKINPGCNITIKAVKLELGSVSTLHLDSAPNPEEEKLRCMLSTADPNDTFANKTLMNPISDEYNPTKIYEVGEMCINGNTLWKAKVQHSGQLQPTNGTDENDYWKRTSVAEELNIIKARTNITITPSNKVTINHNRCYKNALCTYFDCSFKAVDETYASGVLAKLDTSMSNAPFGLFCINIVKNKIFSLAVRENGEIYFPSVPGDSGVTIEKDDVLWIMGAYNA